VSAGCLTIESEIREAARSTVHRYAGQGFRKRLEHLSARLAASVDVLRPVLGDELEGGAVMAFGRESATRRRTGSAACATTIDVASNR
jgi:hypothetical protein